MPQNIKIVGCGVSGLTTGILLLEAGHHVEIISEKLPFETTSAKAAAIWFPYEVKPQEKANLHSKISYDIFEKLCNEPDSGISMIPLTVLIRNEEDAWWKDALPESALRKADRAELPDDYPLGYIMEAPLVETQIYLDYLLNRFSKLGGQITLRKVENLKELGSENEVIVNCTGLGSKELVNDQSMYAIHGQIVKAELQNNVNCIVNDFPHGAAADEAAYIISRKDCLVLGGTATKNKEDITPDDQVTKGIIARCRAIEPNLSDVRIKSIEVGLRPGRPEIRLEKEGNIIHNYGHGGAGFTVSWGCAIEVKGLIE